MASLLLPLALATGVAICSGDWLWNFLDLFLDLTDAL